MGARVVTFPQALGVILGTKVGTTVAGWLIAVVGFKLQLGTIAQPVVLLGALMTMFGLERLRHLGWALAGFSLLFIGIDVIQDDMAPFEGSVTPDDFPPDTWFGRLQLLFIGMAITLVTQSSSAGVATALVALQTGTITFPQTAAMVIGMDMGTTFKTARAISTELFTVLAGLLAAQPARTAASRLQHVHEAVDLTRQVTERIASDSARPHVHGRHLAFVHALDHISRLASRCGRVERIGMRQDECCLRRLSANLRATVETAAGAADGERTERRQDQVRQLMCRQCHLVRAHTLNAAGRRSLDAETALLRLDAGRWLHRVSHQVWRIVHHLRVAEQNAPPHDAVSPLVAEDVDD